MKNAWFRAVPGLFVVLLVWAVASCSSSPPPEADSSTDAVAESQRAAGEGEEEPYLVQAARTHVLVVDGERISPERRVTVARQLVRQGVAEIELISPQDPEAQELMRDEDVTGVIKVATGEGADR